MVASRSPSPVQVRRRLEPFVTRAAATPGADRYRKHFPAVAHLWILLLHMLWGNPSLRRTYAMLTSPHSWWQRWGMDTAISFSQLARSSTSRPSACGEALLADVLAAVRTQAQHDPVARTLQRVAVLDSTFVGLSARLCPWSVHGGHAPGIRLQSMLELGHQIPAPLRLTVADVNDHTALMQRDLTPWCGWTLLYDLGYYSHQALQHLRDAQVHVITRLQPQASYTCTAARPVPAGPTPEGDVIVRDWTITLGSPHNRRGAVLPGMRLVSSRNAAGELQHFVSTRHDLCATEIVLLYRKRWQIELFFRWLKQQLHLTQPLGYSRAAVWLTVLLVLVVTLLRLLLARAQPPGMSHIGWLHHLGITLFIETINDS